MKAQHQFAAVQQAVADEKFAREKAMVANAQQEYLKQLGTVPQGEGSGLPGVTTFSYAYPASVTATGCPVSLGATIPLKNEPKAPQRKKRSGGCC